MYFASLDITPIAYTVVAKDFIKIILITFYPIDRPPFYQRTHLELGF